MDIEKNKAIFPIRILAEKTGINSITLRAWERRYGLLKPKRDPKGHRLYSQADIDKVKRIVTYVEQGVAISQVKKLLKREAEHQQLEDDKPSSVWPDYLQQLLNVGQTLSLSKLESVYNEISSLYPVDIMSQFLLIPLLKVLEERHQAGYTRIDTTRHFLLFYLRNRLGAHFQQLTQLSHGPTLLLAPMTKAIEHFTPLLFGIYLMQSGFRIIALEGPNTLAEITDVLQQAELNGAILYGKLSTACRNHSKTLLKQIDKPIFHYQVLPGRNTTKTFTLPDHFSDALGIIKQQLVKQG